ncbi:MAG TPA: pyridoxamine 5'-phosphate oxidase family protein [Dehalococcoidia bacterium]|nr:pyridoxamine 5'-phosphate oxidase family protein [Dehalococcoidia bacterium]
MPRMKPEDVKEFLKQPLVGVIATLRRDGRPYTVPVWWLWDEQEGVFWLTGTYSRVWCKQLKRDGRISLCIQGAVPDGVHGHVEADGVAEPRELPDFDIWPISKRLAVKYVGRGDPDSPRVQSFFDNMRTEPRLLFRITPQVWRAIDMRVYQGKRGDREYQARVRAGD